MKTIAISSSKGGTGKSTFTIMFANALNQAGYKTAVFDTDLINHSTSFYYNNGINFDDIYEKNIFKIFCGSPIQDNIFTTKSGIDFVHSDVRLQDFNNTSDTNRFTGYLKSIEKDYDYCVIDTSPALDKIVESVINAADFLIIPVVPHIFVYQTLQYYFQCLQKVHKEHLEISIVFNEYEKPRTQNAEAISNQRLDLFRTDEIFSQFLNKHHISKSKHIENYTQIPGFKLDTSQKKVKQFNEVNNVINNILNTTLDIQEL